MFLFSLEFKSVSLQEIKRFATLEVYPLLVEAVQVHCFLTGMIKHSLILRICHILFRFRFISKIDHFTILAKARSNAYEGGSFSL